MEWNGIASKRIDARFGIQNAQLLVGLKIVCYLVVLTLYLFRGFYCVRVLSSLCLGSNLSETQNVFT